MRACRIDNNQPEIVKFFREQEFSVLIISTLKNCCDIVIAKNGKTAMIEIKDGPKKKLTPGETKFRDEWKGQWNLITSIKDATDILGYFE